MYHLSFDDNDNDDDWVEPSEVGSLPLLPLSIVDLVRQGEARRDFKNHLIFRHLQGKVERRGKGHKKFNYN